MKILSLSLALALVSTATASASGVRTVVSDGARFKEVDFNGPPGINRRGQILFPATLNGENVGDTNGY